MKKLFCLILVLTLTAPVLSACHRGGEEQPAETAAPSANPGGPGYTITDGSKQPSVPDPLATLTPQQRAAVTVGGSDEGVDESLLPPGGEVQQEDYLDGGAGAYEIPEADIPLNTYDEAEVAASHAQTSAINAASFQYSAVMDDRVDFTFNYPTEWENVPGVYTVCYREKVEQGQFPARVAVTRKKLVHTPDDAILVSELTSYLKAIAKQYDRSTFQVGAASAQETFMRRRAFSNTYLAYWGSVEIKGYVIGAAVDRTLYVFHFCADYGDYSALESVMKYMASSVQLREDPKKKK